MLSKTKLAKLEKQLNDVQKGCTARMFNMADIQSAIEDAEAEVKKLTPNFRQYVVYEYSPWEVGGSYKYPAEGTSLALFFNKSGNAIFASVSRVRVYANSRERLDITRQSLNSFIKNELGIGDDNITTELRKFALSANGFNPTHYVKTF